ncbi:MAG: metalloregulator ArsR/SmtB family transcription factor [Anaerolineae bacterium]|nr:metalloregulator ArsR/SmtB family transcription factor [Anaerolineae bacterium]
MNGPNTLDDHSHPEAKSAPALDMNTAATMASLFRALSDPTRVRIIAALVEGERCVYDLAATLEMTHSAISHQLQLLRNLRVVRYRKAGRHVFYALDDAHIQGLFLQGLEHARHA